MARQITSCSLLKQGLRANGRSYKAIYTAAVLWDGMRWRQPDARVSRRGPGEAPSTPILLLPRLSAKRHRRRRRCRRRFKNLPAAPLLAGFASPCELRCVCQPPMNPLPTPRSLTHRFLLARIPVCFSRSKRLRRSNLYVCWSLLYWHLLAN